MKKLMMLAIFALGAGSVFALTDIEKGMQNNFATQIGYICGHGGIQLSLSPANTTPYGSNNACNNVAGQIVQAYNAVNGDASDDGGACAQMHGVLTALGIAFSNQGWAKNFKNFVLNNYGLVCAPN